MVKNVLLVALTYKIIDKIVLICLHVFDSSLCEYIAILRIRWSPQQS